MSTGDGLPIKKMRYMVLDEADRLLSGSQKEELEQILSKITSNPQYILMTATYNKVIKELVFDGSPRLFCRNTSKMLLYMFMRAILIPILSLHWMNITC